MSVRNSSVSTPLASLHLSPGRYAVLSTFFHTTTLHGLLQVWESRSRTQRLVFLTAFILSNCMSVYYCCQIIRQYSENPVGTSYLVEQSDTLTLPDVTICPFGRFSLGYMRENNVSEDLITYMETAFFLVSPMYDKEFYDVGKEFRAQVKKTKEMEKLLTISLKRLNLSFEEFLHRASLQCSDVIVECVNGGYGHQGKFNCCKKADSILTNMGRCFKLLPANSRSNVQISSGYSQGLFIQIRLPIDNYAPTSNVALNDGILVKLSEHSKGFDFDAIFVPSGAHALLQLRAEKPPVESSIFPAELVFLN